MSYEVDRDVKMEVSGKSEAGYSVAGLGRCATRLPEYTEKELRAGLGSKVCDEMDHALTHLVDLTEVKELDT